MPVGREWRPPPPPSGAILAGNPPTNSAVEPFFKDWFGDEAGEWRVDEIREVTSHWLNSPDFERERQEAPVFEIEPTVTYWAIRHSINGTWLVSEGEWSDETVACQLFSSEAEAELFARQHNIEKFEIVPFEC
jgi:hypothetical protein